MGKIGLRVKLKDGVDLGESDGVSLNVYSDYKSGVRSWILKDERHLRNINFYYLECHSSTGLNLHGWARADLFEFESGLAKLIYG